MQNMSASIGPEGLTVEDILEARRVEARKQLAAHPIVRQFEQGLMTVGELIVELMVIESRGGE